MASTQSPALPDDVPPPQPPQALESSASTQPPPPRRRSSKACETCRVRRIRCAGPPPCEGCVTAGLASSCAVRLKARPKRAPSAKLFTYLSQNGGTVSAAAAATSASGRAIAGPSRTAAVSLYAARNPLDEVEGALSLFCRDRNLPFSQLVFKVDRRLSGMSSNPLPPSPADRRAYEDALMAAFVASPEFFDCHADQQGMIHNLYGRYRAVPGSLTEDQEALVYAVLCLARYKELQKEMNAKWPLGSAGREDVTYYHMAYDALANWARPSLPAIWALFFLVPYAIGIGGAGETKDLMQQWAWQIRELGMHRQDTASLYAPHEAAQLCAAFLYTDVLRSSLTDLELTMPLSEFDVQPTAPPTHQQAVASHGTFPPAQSQCSDFNARLLTDLADPAIDTATIEYAATAEAQWSPYVRELRHSRMSDLPRIKVAWTQFRYNWLRILLYIPHMSNPQFAPVAYGMLARAASQILYTYADTLAAGYLNPSWPQLQRLVVVGQLLVLCHDAGELHRAEAAALFRLLLDFLARHEDAWPVCSELILGFRAAVRAFGLDLGQQVDQPMREESSAPVQLDLGPWSLIPYGLDLDFDLTAFAP